jgi:type I restriction enzyme R subunit
LLREGKSLDVGTKKKVKKVAVKLLAELKKTELQVEQWRDKMEISAQLKTAIHDSLLHLPVEAYSDGEIEKRST